MTCSSRIYYTCPVLDLNYLYSYVSSITTDILNVQEVSVWSLICVFYIKAYAFEDCLSGKLEGRGAHIYTKDVWVCWCNGNEVLHAASFFSKAFWVLSWYFVYLVLAWALLGSLTARAFLLFLFGVSGMMHVVVGNDRGWWADEQWVKSGLRCIELHSHSH